MFLQESLLDMKLCCPRPVASLVVVCVGILGGGRLAGAQAQAPRSSAGPVPGAAAPPTPEAATLPAPGVVGEAAIAAGNVASARERALGEAFRSLVEQALGRLLAETGAHPSTPAISSLRANWLARPKPLVRSYRVLEQSAEAGVFRVRVMADLDETHMRRELERARASANRGVTPGVVPIVSNGPDEAGAAVSSLLSAEGLRTEVRSDPGASESRVREIAARSGRNAAVMITGEALDEGVVRGAGQHAVKCGLGVRVVPASGTSAGRERRAVGRGFNPTKDEAQASCFDSVARELLPGVLPDLGATARSGDLRAVIVDLDVTEPAVLSPVLRATRRIVGSGLVEVRRVMVGRIELRVQTRLSPEGFLSTLVNDQELGGVAAVTPGAAPIGDRIAARVRLLPRELPAPTVEAVPAR